VTALFRVGAAAPPLNAVFGRHAFGGPLMLMLLMNRLDVALVASLTLLFGGCSVVDEPLPEPKVESLQFECYPVQYMRPVEPPVLRDCPLAHPDLAGGYTILMNVGADGSVLEATVPAEPSADVSECVFGAVRAWKLEPARTCSGDAMASHFRIDYSNVFGVDTCIPLAPPPPVADTRSGRTMRCSGRAPRGAHPHGRLRGHAPRAHTRTGARR